MLAYYLNERKLNVDETGRPQIPIPPTPVGEFTEIELVIENTLEYPMELKSYTNDKDLEITTYPKYLIPQERGKVILTFKPAVERVKPLDTNWGFEITIG